MKPSASQYANEPIRFPPLEVIDLKREGAAVSDNYRNMVLSKVNDHCLRLAIINTDYAWHHHPKSDELFIVLEGCLIIEFENMPEVRLMPWQSITIPAGVVHRTRAQERTVNICFEVTRAETVFK
jgi:mannose-6-phosphate isomerase-like protein (cupin superfamily)